MPPASSATFTAHVIHGGLVLGIVLFWLVGWYVGSRAATPAPLADPRVLQAILAVAGLALFGVAIFTARRLPPFASGKPPDEWWRVNLSRVILVWALLEAPALLGTTFYLLTHELRTMIAPFVSLLLFAYYRPSRFTQW